MHKVLLCVPITQVSASMKMKIVTELFLHLMCSHDVQIALITVVI